MDKNKENEIIHEICSFVSGKVSVEQFKKLLYESETIEEVLKNDPNLKPGNYIGGDLYLYLLERDYSSPTGVLNAQGALCDYLDRNAILYEKSEKYAEDRELQLDAMPKWLDVDAKYLKDEIMKDAPVLNKTELKKWLAKEIKSRFVYVKRPPKWIQNPEWPIGPNGPLVFFGQNDLGDYFHDTAAVYVFYDSKSKVFENIIQTM